MIRYFQAAQMKEKLDMININVYREKISKSFDNQIMATYIIPKVCCVTKADSIGQISRKTYHLSLYFMIRGCSPTKMSYLQSHIDILLLRPEIMGTPHPVSGKLEPHDTWLVRWPSLYACVTD